MATKDINTEAVVTANFTADYVFVSVGGITGPRKASLANLSVTSVTASGRVTATTFATGNNGFSVDTNSAVTCGQITASGGLTVNGNGIIFANLPTSDPLVAGALWDNAGTLKISAG